MSGAILLTNYVSRIITDSLGIGKAGCGIKTECILEGELAVYSELVSCVTIRYSVLLTGFTNIGKENPPFSSYPKTRRPSWSVYEYRGGHPVGPC